MSRPALPEPRQGTWLPLKRTSLSCEQSSCHDVWLLHEDARQGAGLTPGGLARRPAPTRPAAATSTTSTCPIGHSRTCAGFSRAVCRDRICGCMLSESAPCKRRAPPCARLPTCAECGGLLAHPVSSVVTPGPPRGARALLTRGGAAPSARPARGAQLAHPLYGIMMLDFRPVDCVTRRALNFMPGYINSTVYGDRVEAGWAWFPYQQSASAFWAAVRAPAPARPAGAPAGGGRRGGLPSPRWHYQRSSLLRACRALRDAQPDSLWRASPCYLAARCAAG